MDLDEVRDGAAHVRVVLLQQVVHLFHLVRGSSFLIEHCTELGHGLTKGRLLAKTASIAMRGPGPGRARLGGKGLQR